MFVNGMLTARALGDVGRGELGVILLWPSLMAGLAGFGLPDAIAYEASRGSERLASLRRMALAGGLLHAAAVYAAIFLAVPFALSEKHTHLIMPARIYALFVFGNFPVLNIMGIFQGAGRFVWYNSIRLVRSFLYAASVAGLWAAGRAEAGYIAAAYVASNLVLLLLAASACRSELGRCSDPSISLPLGRMLRYGARSHAGRAASIIGQYADIVAGAWFLGVSEYGQYLVARTIPAGVMLVGDAAAVAAFAAVAKDREADAGLSNACRYSRLSIIACLAVGIALAAAAPWLVPAIFGADFLPAGILCSILCLAAVPSASAMVLSAELRAIGRPGIASMAECAGIAAMGGAAIALAPRWGGYGLAAAAIAGATVQTASLASCLAMAAGSIRDVCLPQADDLRWAWAALTEWMKIARRGAERETANEPPKA